MMSRAHDNLPASDRVINPDLTYAEATDHIFKPVLRRGFHPVWIAGFAASALILLLGMVSIAWLLARGVGVWGINVPVAWGFAIINFVWWIGIGHAGTLISAILLLLRQSWRTSINRFAEAMTLFAVACAGLFPLLHLGRITRFYYLLPYPSTIGIWPQWRSPLIWDVFAVMTYGLVSLMFWYVGLLPDLASMRDRSPRRVVRFLSGVFSLGWRGSAKHWQRFNIVYLLMAGLATPLVVSVHSIVSFDFAVGIVPGWHSTIFPPYFVAGAIYAGFAMVIILAVPLRAAFRLHDLITIKHFDQMGKIMLVAGLVVAYGYAMETFTAWFSSEPAELHLVTNRATGHYATAYWATIFCNIICVQPLWFRRVRRSLFGLFMVALAVSVGMWLERFIIVVVSLHNDFLPSSWGNFTATFWDWSLYIGTIGLFATLFFVFIRLLPAISAFEVRELLHHVRSHDKAVDRLENTPATTTSEPEFVTLDPSETSGNRRRFGIMGEFEEPESLRKAADAARAKGLRKMDAYTPFPVERLDESLGFRCSQMPLLGAIGAILGGSGAYAMQWYTAAHDYPLNIGGRPLHSWPSFIPLTFELAVLGAAFALVLGMLASNGFPRPHHPVFDARGFARASVDRFFLLIEERDRRFDEQTVCDLLAQHGALRIIEVPDQASPLREEVTHDPAQVVA
jgi:Ni/Fe-hydrogenase subunit HybB-like protein